MCNVQHVLAHVHTWTCTRARPHRCSAYACDKTQIHKYVRHKGRSQTLGRIQMYAAWQGGDEARRWLGSPQNTPCGGPSRPPAPRAGRRRRRGAPAPWWPRRQDPPSASLPALHGSKESCGGGEWVTPCVRSLAPYLHGRKIGFFGGTGEGKKILIMEVH